VGAIIVATCTFFFWSWTSKRQGICLSRTFTFSSLLPCLKRGLVIKKKTYSPCPIGIFDIKKGPVNECPQALFLKISNLENIPQKSQML